MEKESSCSESSDGSKIIRHNERISTHPSHRKTAALEPWSMQNVKLTKHEVYPKSVVTSMSSARPQRKSRQHCYPDYRGLKWF